MNPTTTLGRWAKFWSPEDISTHGHKVDLLMDVIHWFMLALFIGWGLFFLYSLFRFRTRAHPNATYEPARAKLSKGAEIAVVIFEIVLLVGFSMPVWARTRNKSEMPQPEDDPLIVRIVAQQFQWNVHYPGTDGVFGRTRLDLIDPTENPIGLDRDDDHGKDDVVTLAWLRVPKDRPLLLRLSSLDVIHCFWIPATRVKQDVIPGMEIPIWFTPTVLSDELRDRSALRVRVPSTDEKATTRWLNRYKNRIAGQDYDGWAKGSLLNSGALEKLQSSGETHVTLAPLEPMEIHCAQLCGLNHYSMRGFFKVMTPEDWGEWYDAAVAEALEEGAEDDWGDDDEDEDED